MSDRIEEVPPPEGIEEPEEMTAAEAAAWAALVALLGAAAAAVIVEGLVDLSLWPDDAWNPADVLSVVGRVYGRQFTGLQPDTAGTVPEVPPVAADDAGRRAREWIAERENPLTRAGDSVYDQVRAKADQALAEGMSERELVAYIAEILNPDTTEVDWRARAQRIARTEVHSAEQAGQDAFTDQLVRSGVIAPPRFAWLWTRDNRTRPRPAPVGPFDHHDIEPVTWPEPFIVSGEPLRFPGDPTGSPGNVINCRCTKIRVA